MTDMVKEQILEVLETGEANMLDTNAVQYIADREGFYELVIFIEEQKSEYIQFIFTGDTGR